MKNAYPRTLDELVQALDRIMGEGCGHSHFSSHPMRKAQVEERTRAAIEYFLRYQQEQYKATL